MTEQVLRSMRGQSWQRAKGELRAMLQTFWHGTARGDQFDALDEAIKEFIEKVENEGLHE